MKKWRSLVIFVFLCLYSYSSYSQTGCVEPLPPVLTLVSVQPETGFTQLTWTLSPSPDIYAYVIYFYYNENGTSRGDSIDIVMDPSATSYTYTSLVSNYFTKSYAIASRARPYCRSRFSNVINSIFATASVDSCNKKLVVNWNSYPSSPKAVIDYSILAGVNGGTLTEAGRVTADKTSYTLNDFTNDAGYCFVVRANLEGGISSSSNKACLVTKMQRPPDWINADWATVNGDNKIDLSFSLDPLSAITSFRLERKVTGENDFSLLTRIESNKKNITYTDNSADPQKPNFYRLLAVNNCNIPVVSSNLSCNIVPVLEKQEDQIKIIWNSYNLWLGRVSGYEVFVDKGNGYTLLSSVIPPDTTYLFSYSSIMYDIAARNLCFYISASESSNPFAIKGETNSVRICTDIIERITVPNAFTPNNDLVNDFFRPVLSFTPSDYYLVITDMKNNVLFESHDPFAQWDGKKGGENLSQGVYLWFLKVKTPSGKQLTRSGTVTILK